jgi:hypothetical protein
VPDPPADGNQPVIILSRKALRSGQKGPEAGA